MHCAPGHAPDGETRGLTEDNMASGAGPQDDCGEPTATLAEVDILSELAVRPRRAADHERENRALASLAKEMARKPRNMLQKLVETAVELCNAHTAGISLLEGNVFRWEAVAGVFAAYRNGTMPREASPCGVCIDRDATQLMHLAERCFPALRNEPRFVEALLIPFHFQGAPIGTVWIVSHTSERMFDLFPGRLRLPPIGPPTGASGVGPSGIWVRRKPLHFPHLGIRFRAGLPDADRKALREKGRAVVQAGKLPSRPLTAYGVGAGRGAPCSVCGRP